MRLEGWAVNKARHFWQNCHIWQAKPMFAIFLLMGMIFLQQ
jgi:hypothetical protein